MKKAQYFSPNFTTEIIPLQQLAIQLLKTLIAIPSYSKEENKTADAIEHFLAENSIKGQRVKNNVWATNLHFDAHKKTILLNSHHDTVRPNQAFTLDPFSPIEQAGKLYGLGSNDAGGALVSLLACFLYYYNKEALPFNLLFLASAEEEISGTEGVEMALNFLPPIEFGIVGEPTQMEMAIAERGLLVLDIESFGKPGHVAREEGVNALYQILADLDWFRNYQFEKSTPLLGKVKMSVTVIETSNKQHNVIPENCRMVVDIRINECYTLEEILATVRMNVQSKVSPRSVRIRPSYISIEHELVQAGILLGKGMYGSPTCSDQALMQFPTIKMGPGDAARSHTADEFIYLHEIEEGIVTYIQLIEKIFTNE